VSWPYGQSPAAGEALLSSRSHLRCIPSPVRLDVADRRARDIWTRQVPRPSPADQAPTPGWSACLRNHGWRCGRPRGFGDPVRGATVLLPRSV